MTLFLVAMHPLKRYPTELEREPIFDIDCTKGRDWVWFFVEKIQQLKTQKIFWPAGNFGTDGTLKVPASLHKLWYYIELVLDVTLKIGILRQDESQIAQLDSKYVELFQI
jgi:hypothetical protein